MGAVGRQQETARLDIFSQEKRVVGVVEGGEDQRIKSDRKRRSGEYMKWSATV